MVSTKSKPKLARNLLTSVTMSTLEDRLRLALKHAQATRPNERINQAWLSREVGISTAAITKWFNGGTQKLEGENLVKASRAMGVVPDWLASGDGPMVGNEPEGSDVFPRIPNEDDFVLIPQYTTKGSCGTGFMNDHVELVGGLAFKRSWLERMRLDKDNACIIYASGDSMYPSISDGDVLLLDKTGNSLRSDEVYAVMSDDEVVVKRLRKGFGGIVLRGDNPNKAAYPDIDVPPGHDLAVIGRVVWRGGGM